MLYVCKDDPHQLNQCYDKRSKGCCPQMKSDESPKR